jgi:putative hydrolase of the HAD superfamily
MLTSLKRNGYKLGLISNCSSEEVTVLKNNALYTYFDNVILSYEVKCAKPDQKIYDLSMKELGVLPEQCVYIGDGGSDELNGAKKAGMTPIQAAWYIKDYNNDYINPFGFTYLQQPSEVVDILKRKIY